MTGFSLSTGGRQSTSFMVSILITAGTQASLGTALQYQGTFALLVIYLFGPVQNQTGQNPCNHALLLDMLYDVDCTFLVWQHEPNYFHSSFPSLKSHFIGLMVASTDQAGDLCCLTFFF